MKIFSTFCLALVLIFSFGFTFDYYPGSGPVNITPMVPDVLGNVKIINSDGRTQIVNINSTDSFPLFSGFPKNNLVGQVSEGGILCNMDGDNDLEIVYNTGYTIQAWNFDGSNVPGWPVTVPALPLDGAPACGDIDGDGELEIVVVNHGATVGQGGNIIALEKNGTAVTGFPIVHGYSSRTPVLANLDGAGGLEIIVNKRQLSSTSEIWVYRGTGVVFPGWPKLINHYPASSSAVGDITGDGMPEVVSESVSSLYAWGADGNPIAGFPYSMPGGDVNSYSSPVLVDVDGDNIREIVFGTHNSSVGDGAVYLLKNNGTLMSGWPKRVTQWIYGPPAVGYIDGDNIIDIAVGDQVSSGTPIDYINAWNKNGTSLTGFPIGPINAVNNQITLADIDNDNNFELICDDNTSTAGRGKYLAFNHDGSPVAGWDVNTNGATFFSTPMLGDVNRDGVLDIAGSGMNFSPITSTFYLWNTAAPYIPLKIINPMWQFNSRHNGVYGDNPLVGIEPISGVMPSKFSLGQNYPNPFNPATKIKFEIPAGVSAYTTLKIFDMLGREVNTLVSEELVAGTYEVAWSAKNQPSGVYFYKLNAGNFTQTKKMLMVK
ncbi:MAG: T9SS type A sorting domain-containing protein [Ignavibacteria bacterium]|nr:T9SS type A sorting domain-containing protein [Ignavibacteria bacterium]